MNTRSLARLEVVGGPLVGDDAPVNQPVASDAIVFVVAPGNNVLLFQTARSLVTDLRQMEPEERAAASYFTLDGEELELVDPTGHGIWPVHTGRDRLAELRDALATLADDPSASTDPRDAANDILRKEWEDKWPRRPKWLRRIVAGRAAPTVDDR